MSEWPFPISAVGSMLDFEHLDQLAPGVRGYAVVVDGCAYIPLIEAQHPGSGDVGRFLDSLPSGVKVPNITSSRLRGMLKRRHFIETEEEGVDVWIKP